MRLLIKEEPRTLALQSESHVLVFRYISDAHRCAIELLNVQDFHDEKYKPLTRSSVSGFIGFIEIKQDIFICVITGKFQVANPVEGESVDKIMSVEFHCLNKSSWDFIELDSNGQALLPNDSEEYEETRIEQNPTFELRKLLCDGSFYYSSDFDLTSNLQNRGLDKQSLSFDSFSQEYMWNWFMLKEIVKYRNNLENSLKETLDANGFLTTVIRGFAETLSTHIKQLPAKLTMISKQSWKRAGTRFLARGIDDEGNVANFVECEVILFVPDKILFSFIQVRGSVPVFWEQDTTLVTPKVTVTRSFEATHPIFEKHFNHLNEEYGPVHVVNLLSKRTSEVQLSKRYRDHVDEFKKHKGDSVAVTDFDFHQETGKNFALAGKVLRYLQESCENFGFFSYNLVSDQNITKQSGVFRTNCLDCLDRTNVVQQVIAKRVLEQFLQSHNIDPNTLYDLFQRYNTLWADHGDAISQIYTGTNALKSSFTRSGKMGLAGALSDVTKSVSRIYINNFMDKGKQLTIDTMLGKLPSQSVVRLFDPVSDIVLEELKSHEKKFTSWSQIGLLVLTYNVSGSMTLVKDLSQLLFPCETSPDVVCIGLQEVIELTASNILNADTSKASYWIRTVEDQMAKHRSEKYVLVRSESMSSLLVLMFVKAASLCHVSNVEGSSKKTGFGGMTANKGGVGVRFQYNDTTFCVVNSHFAAGASNVEERNNDYLTIRSGLTFTRNKKIDSHDSVIWMGDMNYRIALSNHDVRSCIDQNDFAYLWQFDQLKSEMGQRAIFQNFSEGQLAFKPTYKYDMGTSDYDTSEKQRVPSWTDRVVYKGEMSLTNYNSVDGMMYSDHKPVYAGFSAKVKNIDKVIKKRIMKELYSGAKDKVTGSSSLIDLNEFTPPPPLPFRRPTNSDVSSIVSAPSIVAAPSVVAAPLVASPPLVPSPRKRLSQSAVSLNALEPSERKLPPIVPKKPAALKPSIDDWKPLQPS